MGRITTVTNEVNMISEKELSICIIGQDRKLDKEEQAYKDYSDAFHEAAKEYRDANKIDSDIMASLIERICIENRQDLNPDHIGRVNNGTI